MKRIHPTTHARLQCSERGVTEAEVIEAVEKGVREPAKFGHLLCRYNVAFGRAWQGNLHAVKQVAPVVREEGEVIVVITVHAFYF